MPMFTDDTAPIPETTGAAGDGGRLAQIITDADEQDAQRARLREVVREYVRDHGPLPERLAEDIAARVTRWG